MARIGTRTRLFWIIGGVPNSNWTPFKITLISSEVLLGASALKAKPLASDVVKSAMIRIWDISFFIVSPLFFADSQ